jgi:putative endonuclease
VGSTDNIERRLEEHNIGKSKFTSIYKPWKLVYTEDYSTRESALKRERYLKSASGRRYLKSKVFI